MYALVVIILHVFLPLFSHAVPVDTSDRIVNGTDANISDFPYMVSLQFNNRHTCGGSIINEYNILTAAHCVTRELSSFSVLAGSTSITEGLTIPVERIIIHEDYIGNVPFNHDIAVLHLRFPLTLSNRIRPVTLPEPFSPTPENAEAVLTGWGLQMTGGVVQNILQKVDIQVFPDDICEDAHRITGPTNRRVHICAGVPEGGKGQCNGDSGGPLVVNGVEVGIVSWSVKPCTIRGYPGVFVKVSTYIDWIFTHLKLF